MISRFFFLYALSFKAAWHRLRFQLARELVVGTCTAVLLGLFFYIFSNFLNEKIADLTPAFRQRLAERGAFLILTIGTLVAAGHVRRSLINRRSLQRCAWRLGEHPVTVRAFLLFRLVTFLGVWYAALWQVLAHSFIKIDDAKAATWQALQILLLGCLIWLRRGQRKERLDRASRLEMLIVQCEKRSDAMFIWRLFALVLRNATARWLLGLAAACTGLTMWLFYRQSPFFLSYLSAFIGGFALAAMLPFQLEQDLKSAWAERSMAVSHGDIMQCYRRIAFLFSATFAGVILVGILVIAWLVKLPWQPIELFQLAAGSITPLLLMPSLFFQIDARRPLIALMVAFLVSLFIGTAVLAHPLGVVLIPVAYKYAADYQQNLFYRA